MRKRVLNNKKGFTLVELIVVVALMAVLAGTVTPSVYYTTEKRQKSTAEYDTQMVYRNCVAGITFLSNQGVTVNKPYTTRSDTYKQMTQDDIDEEYGKSTNISADTYYVKTESTNFIFKNGWYIEYTRLLTKRIYQTLTGIDIDVFYYNPQRLNKDKGILCPKNCEASDRSQFIVAGNKNPKIVIQVINTESDESGDTYLIVSYHNDKNEFKAPSLATLTPDGDYSGFNSYTNNSGTHIYYTYKIRT